MFVLFFIMMVGNIGVWNKKFGDSIVFGEVFVEIEIDKVQMDFEFQEEGVLVKVFKDMGVKDVVVGNVSYILLFFIVLNFEFI